MTASFKITITGTAKNEKVLREAAAAFVADLDGVESASYYGSKGAEDLKSIKPPAETDDDSA